MVYGLIHLKEYIDINISIVLPTCEGGNETRIFLLKTTV